MNFATIRADLLGISVHRALMQQPTMRACSDMLEAIVLGRGEAALGAYVDLFYSLQTQGFQGLGAWLGQQLRDENTPYSQMVERGECESTLEAAARVDIETFCRLSMLDCTQILAEIGRILPKEFSNALENLPRWETCCDFDYDTLTQYYRTNGAGMFGKYRAFLWENGELVPVSDPDCPTPQDMLGYELQRTQVEKNTRQLISGHAANNVLLFGDGGTGKSATVKSMLYLAGMEQLRLIEIQKENLIGLPQLMRSLRGQRQKFILFIDDLAFDQDDKTYSSLKTILEGSLEKRPQNVAIYATSNRRHLVRQSFSDRAGDEVDTFETISEKTALAERFGLRIPYLTMNKQDYLALVEQLAAQAGIEMQVHQLHAAAMTWEIRHAGRTPRTARQFIASLAQ